MNSLWIQAFKDKYYISTGSRNGVLAKKGDTFVGKSFPIEFSDRFEKELSEILVFDSYDEANKFIQNTFKITSDKPQMIIVGDYYDEGFNIPLDGAVQKISKLEY